MAVSSRGGDMGGSEGQVNGGDHPFRPPEPRSHFTEGMVFNQPKTTADAESLRDWAPHAPPPEELPESKLPHLPKLPPTPKGRAPVATSKPLNIPLTPMQQSISYSLARLLSLPRFLAFLSTSLGFAQFHAYLTAQASKHVAELELWRDIVVLRGLERQASFASKGIREVYLGEEGSSHVDLSREAAKEFIRALREICATSTALDGTARDLLDSLYASEFESFVRHRLLKHTHAQLSKYHLKTDDDRSGIAEAFCLTNPRLHDNPIVMVSPGFVQLTGYTASQIIGRNCRFLQGKASSPAAVTVIKQALDEGKECTQLLLNYTAEGRPFMNLLNIIPLRDTEGELTYFIGGQCDITQSMTTGSDLSFLLPEDEALSVDMNCFSPAVQLEVHEAAGNLPSKDRVIPPALDRRTGPEVDIPSLSPTPPPEKATAGPPLPGQVEAAQMGPSIRTLVVGVKNRFNALWGKIGKGKTAQPEEPDDVPLAPPPQKREAQLPVERHVEELKNTYDKLLIVKREGREILFATSGFLRWTGLPGAARQDIDRSPLVHTDLVDILVAAKAPSPVGATNTLRDKVKTAIHEGKAMNAACGLQIRKDKGPSGPAENYPVVVGRIWVSPLLDLYAECGAVTIVFG
ncbi:hypothetical protein JCM1840_006721 [Sporobolomyces johnsonii]